MPGCEGKDWEMMHKESGKQMGSSDLGRGMGKGRVEWPAFGEMGSTASSRERVMGEGDRGWGGDGARTGIRWGMKEWGCNLWNKSENKWGPVCRTAFLERAEGEPWGWEHSGQLTCSSEISHPQGMSLPAPLSSSPASEALNSQLEPLQWGQPALSHLAAVPDAAAGD